MEIAGADYPDRRERFEVVYMLLSLTKNHRIMVQVQSTWFPLFDRNPQTYVDNIFLADDADFVTATHGVYHAPGQASYLEVKILP